MYIHKEGKATRKIDEKRKSVQLVLQKLALFPRAKKILSKYFYFSFWGEGGEGQDLGVYITRYLESTM
jgi:hypothetical protein